MNEQYILAIVDEEELLNSRYPEAVGVGSAQTPILAGRAADISRPEVVGAVVDSFDNDEILLALRSQKPTLLGLESLATLVREMPESTDTLLDYDWSPFLPTALSIEVLTAAEILNTGSLGTIKTCNLTTYVGPITTETWEQDAPFVRSFFEATALGLDLLTRIFDRSVTSTHWLETDIDAKFGVAIHRFGSDVTAIQKILPGRLAASPLFTAAVHCESGRILIRNEFAPGGVAVWSASSRSFHCPAFTREKPNIQAPDTSRGGAETAAMIAALGDGKRTDLPSREHALEIVRHVTASGVAEAWTNGV